MNKRIQVKNSTVRTIMLLLFSLVCALLLWVYVTDTEGVDIRQSFPGVSVVFEGENTLRDSRGLIVSDTSTTSARVWLTGSRRTVSALTPNDLTVSVDLSTITSAGYYERAPSVSYPARFDASAIAAVETDPETVRFYVDILDRATIPVQGIFNGSAAEGFVAEPLVFNPGTVMIYGPAQVISQVDHAYVEVTRTEVNRTLTFDSTYTLIDAEGNEIESDEISFDSPTVSVTLPISAVKDVALVVDFVAGGGATDANVRWEFDPPVITLTGDSEVLAGVNNITVARIDLSQVTEDSYTDTYRIVIPNDTEITSGAREATLTMELFGLYKQSFSIRKDNITCINISEGYSWEIMNDALDNVIIRCPDEEELRNLSELNLRAVADLTEYGTATGFISVPVKIYVDGAPDAGAVGEYSVYVNITETTNETE